MPIHEVALPVGAKQLSPNMPTITRSSKDGNIPVAKIFAGDNFVGDVLEGQWVYGADSVWTDPFTAKIASGQLDLAGAHSSSKFGWINGKTPFIMKQNCYIDVHMKVETVTPSNSFAMHFYLRSEESTDRPFVNGDSIDMRIMRSGSTTYISGTKTVGGSGTSIYATTAITNDEGTFRFKFRPEDELIDIYFHDGAGDVVESTDELTLLDDAFDFTFDIGYPAFEYECNNTTNYTVSSEGVTASYPDMVVAYLQDEADIGKGDVKCYDTMGSVTESDWRRVYSEGHVFTGDCVIENGLVRLVIDEAAEFGVEMYYWTGSAWSQPLDTIRAYQDTDAKSLSFAFFKQIISMTRSESIALKVRVCETATESYSQYVDLLITLARGKYHLTFVIDESVPTQSVRFVLGDSAPLRWHFLGDDDIGDYDLTITATNTTLTDNFMVSFDDAGSDVLGFIAMNQKPTAESSAFYSFEGNYISLYSIASADFAISEIHVGLIPYQDVDKLFKEAESGTTNGTDDVADAGASGGYKVELDAQDEYVYFELTGITDLPVGKYKMIVRAKDTAQVADDLELYVYNQTESKYMNEDRTESPFTATASYALYSVVFEVTSVDSADTIRFYANKGTATANTISVDYFLIVPISDGETFVQDIAHNEMRTKDQGFRVLDLASFEVFAGMGIYSSSLSSGYTDAMAIAAVENEQTLDLKGVLTASTIKTKADNEGLSVGASDDLRMFHDGVNTYFRNNTGDMILQSLGGNIRLETADFFLDSTGAIKFRDSDDSDVVLLELDTDARTLTIGQVADHIVTTHYGDINLVGELKLEAATIHSAAGAIHIHPNTGNTDGNLILHPIGTNTASIFYLRNLVGANYGQVEIGIDGTTVSLISSLSGSGTAPTTFNLDDPNWDIINIGDGSATITIGGLAYPPSTVAHVLATTGPHTDSLPLIDIASYVQGSIIIGGGADWEALVAGAENNVLKMGAAEPAWGQVDYSELIGTQPAPVVHNLVDTTGHPVTGLTAGHVLTAISPTTYGFSAPSGAGIGGSGTVGTIPKFVTDTTTIGDSLITDDGTTIIVSGPFRAGSAGFDIDASGNITDVGTILGATITQMPTYPHAGLYGVNNGASFSVWHSGSPLVVMPASDTDCSFWCNLKIPEGWIGTTGNLKIMYAPATTFQVYSGIWIIGSFTFGNGITTPNVLNASTAYDFSAQTNNDRWYEKTIPLTNLAAGDILSIRFISDASNGTAIYITDIYLTP